MTHSDDQKNKKVNIGPFLITFLVIITIITLTILTNRKEPETVKIKASESRAVERVVPVAVKQTFFVNKPGSGGGDKLIAYWRFSELGSSKSFYQINNASRRLENPSFVNGWDNFERHIPDGEATRKDARNDWTCNFSGLSTQQILPFDEKTNYLTDYSEEPIFDEGGKAVRYKQTMWVNNKGSGEVNAYWRESEAVGYPNNWWDSG